MSMKTFSCAVLVSLTLLVPLAVAQEAQTLKERLSDRASDVQRVDNCHVPVERRGAVPRPDCTAKPGHLTETAEAGSPANPR
jgi:hypothetical protein